MRKALLVCAIGFGCNSGGSHAPVASGSSPVTSSGSSTASPETRSGSNASPDEIYRNPVDGKTYVSPGGWKTFTPQVVVTDDPSQKVKLKSIRLLTSEDDIAKRTTVDELVAFILNVRQRAETTVGKSTRPLEVMVQLSCSSAGHQAKMAFKGEADEAMLQKLSAAIDDMPKLRVKDGDVMFELHLVVEP